MEQVVRQEVIEVVVEKGSETRPEQSTTDVWFFKEHVRDQDNDMAVFDDLASSANLMIAGKFIDVVGSLGGNTQEQSDAELAINGHPLSGVFWEKHCGERLRRVGFERVHIHRRLRFVLLIYVDDFKMTRPDMNIKTN